MQFGTAAGFNGHGQRAEQQYLNAQQKYQMQFAKIKQKMDTQTNADYPMHNKPQDGSAGAGGNGQHFQKNQVLDPQQQQYLLEMMSQSGESINYWSSNNQGAAAQFVGAHPNHRVSSLTDQSLLASRGSKASVDNYHIQQWQQNQTMQSVPSTITSTVGVHNMAPKSSRESRDNGRKEMHIMGFSDNHEEQRKFQSSRNDAKSVSPTTGTGIWSQKSGSNQRGGRAERIGEVQVLPVDQACDVIHAYAHVISLYINYTNNLDNINVDNSEDFEITLKGNEAQKLTFCVISLTLHILSRKFEKQARVEFLQKTVTINSQQ